MSDVPKEIVKVLVLGREVILDPSKMKYNENSLGKYMSEEYAWVDYLGKQLEYAQKELLFTEIELEALYSRKFMESKDAGNSDNYAKAFALANDDYVAFRKKYAERKEVVGHIKAHLKAFDKNHENAQNRGHTLRKEMDKINRDIYSDEPTCAFEDNL